MKLYFKDTERSYSDISNLLTSHIGLAGPDTWQNGAELCVSEKGAESTAGFFGYIEIYDDNHPGASFVALKW